MYHGLISSILFSLVYAPNTYAPSLSPESLIGQVMAQHQVHGARSISLLHDHLVSYRHAPYWQSLIPADLSLPVLATFFHSSWLALFH